MGELASNSPLAEELTEQLRGVYDVERLVARAVTGRATPRDLSCVGRTLRLLPKLKARLAGRQSRLLARLETDLDLLPDLRAKLDTALEDDCPLASHTSPTRTSSRVSVFLPFAVSVAGSPRVSGSSVICQFPSAPAFVDLD